MAATNTQDDSMEMPENNYYTTKTIKSRSLFYRKSMETIFFLFFRLSALICGLALAILFYFLIVRGWSAITWTFLTQPPREAMTEGGILPCIVGTFGLSIGAILVALPIGIMTAIYLTEYATEGKLLRIVRLGISNLAGVPSVVFGLFGLALFCILLNMGVSLLAGALTLSIMSLPIIIGSTEEALRTVPDSYRYASEGLGATKWQTIYRVILPAATPGIITGAILSVSRVAGETAPIMFTGAVFFSPALPTSLFDSVMALPYHIYVLATAGTNIEQTRNLQYGTALVLIALVFLMNILAIVIRSGLRKKMRF